MLQRAGLVFDAIAAETDETAIKDAYRAAGRSAAALAGSLAEAKALEVAARYPEAMVIGADQVLECDGTWFDKPADLVEAARHIRLLRGREHVLQTAVCCARGTEILWRRTEAPELVMRDVSDAFIADYVAAEGEALLSSVGAYRLEARGANLFERVEGDFFAILGLPLLPLLDFLRRIGVIAS